ncbi:sugar ABC transporter substrate-binding protein [Streptomyces olivaceoviridis]|uniref:extracellular solute-binding protein n=1 Tax=Streptomyces olivaceoviridis TaxID=1921 RepID=UPI00167607D9|nr:extracellular solute-binding protein [Streptomyces olivaceoviridis]GGZ17327.1 sugar ABC transporter substrate-binding protein [Streptomyces olivaceoviridis]
MRRGISFAAAATVVALTASACGGSGGGSSSKPKDPKDISGTITYWDTSDAATEAPTYKALIKKFENKYPHIKVNYQNVPFTDIEQKFKSAAKSGKGAPDVVRTDVGLMAEYAELGYIAPLDGTAALKDTDDFSPVPLNTARYKGKTYGVPSVTDTLGLLYNKKLLKKAGIAEPPATWDEFIADAKTIKQKTGAYGTYLNPDSYFLLPLLYSNGADLADPSAKKITINDGAAVKALTTAKKINDEASMKVDFANAYQNMQAAFKNGKVAMLIQGPWSVGDDLGGTAFKGDEGNLGFAPVPAGAGGKAQAPTGGHNLTVYQGSGNLDAGYLFTQFMTSTPSQIAIAEGTGTLPTRKSAYTSEVTGNAKIAGFQPILEKTARARVALPQAGSLFTPLAQNYAKILQGDESVQGGLDATAKEFQKLLNGYSIG